MDQYVFKIDRSEDHSIALTSERFVLESPETSAYPAHIHQLDDNW